METIFYKTILHPFYSFIESKAEEANIDLNIPSLAIFDYADMLDVFINKILLSFPSLEREVKKKYKVLSRAYIEVGTLDYYLKEFNDKSKRSFLALMLLHTFYHSDEFYNITMGVERAADLHTELHSIQQMGLRLGRRLHEEKTSAPNTDIIDARFGVEIGYKSVIDRTFSHLGDPLEEKNLSDYKTIYTFGGKESFVEHIGKNRYREITFTGKEEIDFPPRPKERLFAYNRALNLKYEKIVPGRFEEVALPLYGISQKLAQFLTEKVRNYSLTDIFTSDAFKLFLESNILESSGVITGMIPSLAAENREERVFVQYQLQKIYRSLITRFRGIYDSSGLFAEKHFANIPKLLSELAEKLQELFRLLFTEEKTNNIRYKNDQIILQTIQFS